MYLTKKQEKMLRGEYGWVVAKALEVIVRVGESLGADKLVEINHVHVSGVSYTNIGEPGLEFIRDFTESGGKARVYTTINPGCIDLSGSSKIIDSSPRDKQLMINSFLEKMGFKPIYTCIPYLYRIPSPREHLAWGESSAVIYANSIYGAYTNREGGPLALASALTGYTYNYGLHILDNRRVSIEINIEQIKREHYGALGLWIGYNIREIPMIKNVIEDYSSIKIMLASSAASGSHGLIVLENITPKNTYLVDNRLESVTVEYRDIEEYIGTPPSKEDTVLGYIGCPHLDPYEFIEIYRLLLGRRERRQNKYLLLSIPPLYSRVFSREISYLRKIGVDIGFGTCPIVSRLRQGFDYLVTNSGKAVFYMKNIHGFNTYIASPREIVEMIYG